MLLVTSATATPANKAALARHYEKFLPVSLNDCVTCHQPAKLDHAPENLDEFPHNPFGARLRQLGAELRADARKADIATRLKFIAHEDADGDGVSNEIELLLGHAPGDAADKPTRVELRGATARQRELEKFLASYRWQPFETVQRPPVPKTHNAKWVRNPIDAFIAAERDARKLKPRPEAAKEVLLRRVTLDLIGLSPTPEELAAFENDKLPDAYERVVARLLADPRYGERWGRHWLDIWRYSDWAGWAEGNQIRDSQPHIWRWRDWTVESLNRDKSYDRMILELLAADELVPEDTDALRATGFLVRNYKMLSREQWIEDTVKHTSQAFLGITMGCAKCHDHMHDPISQREYYQLRAVFEPHNVRTDRVAGEFDTKKNGLVRAFDADLKAATYFLPRGDDRHPDKSKVFEPALPVLWGGTLRIAPVHLPRFAAYPNKRDFVFRDQIAASETEVSKERAAMKKLKADAKATPEKIKAQEIKISIAEAQHASLVASIKAEQLEDEGKTESEEWKLTATDAATAQRQLAALDAKLKLHQAQVAQTDSQSKADAAAKAVEVAPEAEKATKKNAADAAAKAVEETKKKTVEAEKVFAEAEKQCAAPPTTSYKPRPQDTYPATSSGRRLAFARWITSAENPLAARVAMNHIWARHFGQALVPTVTDFGSKGQPPTHPQLLDWLAAEFMARGWSMKQMHRLIVTSSTYRMDSRPDAASAKIDPDNKYLWRMNSRRMEAELVRDNVLFVSGQIDATMGGPEVDCKQGLVSKRRSIYLRLAAEKEVEFLKIFDGPSVVECYERKPTVMPQQALALANSELVIEKSRALTATLAAEVGEDDARFVARAFERVLVRRARADEAKLCVDFLRKPAEAKLRARENLVLVLFNQNDFVTIR